MSNDELPNGWTEIGFSELNSFSSSTINPADYPSEIFELYSVPIFPTRKPEILKGADIGSTKQAVAADDVLICKINPRINRVWKVMPKTTRRQIASSEWIAMRAPGTNPDYLRAYFSSHEFREILCEDLTGVGGSLTRAQPKRVAKFKIPLAPLAEQKRIADKLEAVLGRVDSCRARLDRVPALLKRFRQSVLAAATTGKLTEEWRTTNDVNGEWENSPLGSVVNEIKNGLAPKPKEQPPGTPILRISSVRTFQVHQTDIRYLSPSVAVEPYRLRIGDLLFTRYNGSLEFVGVCGLVRKISVKGLVYPDKLIRVRVNKEQVMPDWIEIAANSPQARDVIENKARTSAGQTGISGKDLRELLVPIPTFLEQQEIVRRVEDLFAFADRIEARLATAQKTVERLTPATLGKAFRGELVPQDPTDEPATKLLERFKSGSAPTTSAINTRRKLTAT